MLARRILPFHGLNNACLNTTVVTSLLNTQCHLLCCIIQFNKLLRVFVPSLYVWYIVIGLVYCYRSGILLYVWYIVIGLVYCYRSGYCYRFGYCYRSGILF